MKGKVTKFNSDRMKIKVTKLLLKKMVKLDPLVD